MVDATSVPRKRSWRSAPYSPRLLRGLSDLCLQTAFVLQRSGLALFRAGLLSRRASLFIFFCATRLSRVGFAMWRLRRERRRQLREAFALRARSQGRQAVIRKLT